MHLILKKTNNNPKTRTAAVIMYIMVLDMMWVTNSQFRTPAIIVAARPMTKRKGSKLRSMGLMTKGSVKTSSNTIIRPANK